MIKKLMQVEEGLMADMEGMAAKIKSNHNNI